LILNNHRGHKEHRGEFLNTKIYERMEKEIFVYFIFKKFISVNSVLSVVDKNSSDWIVTNKQSILGENLCQKLVFGLCY
jgi:hypothetical protein